MVQCPPRSLATLSTLATILAIAAASSRAEERLGPFDRAPRSVRSRPFDVKHIRLELGLDWKEQSITGRAVHRLAPFRATRSLRFDAREMSVTAVERVARDSKTPAGEPALQGDSLQFEQFDEHLDVYLPEELAAGEEVLLAISYLVKKPEYGGHFVVPDAYEPKKIPQFWTQSEPQYARYWYPCLDSPNDRLSSEVLVTVPRDFFVLSNGRLVDERSLEDGRKQFHWINAKTHVPYLISVVAGQFDTYQQEADGVPIVSYVPRGRLADAERSFSKTAAMMRYFNRRIGLPYPWPKYAQVCVDEYNWGGMEHTSATTLTLRTLHDERAALDESSDGLVAHELAHQWWGNLLTCKDWAELWLNESFATYFTTLWYEQDRGWDEATWSRHREAAWYLKEDKEKYRRPIVTYRYPRPGSMFDGHSYPKGARVLHMLRHVLGDDAFWRSIRRYAQENQFRVVETADLRRAVEEASGQGINWFFDQWLYRGGYPEYEVQSEWDDADHTLRLTVKQTQEVDSVTPLFRMPVEIEMVLPGGRQKRRITVDRAEETFTFALEERPERVLFDPRDWILKKLNFPKSKQALLGQLAGEPHVMCRHRAIEQLKKQTKDAQVGEALIEAARGDAFWGIRAAAAEALAEFRGEEIREALIGIARDDERSEVRRAAVTALAKFPHDQTRKLLRERIAGETSYRTVAAALGALAKVDPENCQGDLRAALELSSHQDVILKAACDALAERNVADTKKQLLAMLDPPSSADRRLAVMAALARLGQGDSQVTEKLASQLESPRLRVRRAAIAALGKTGDSGALEILREQKEQEQSSRIAAALDEAIAALEKAREKEKEEESGSGSKLKSQLELLEKKNRQLEKRLRKLEEKRAAGAAKSS